MFEHGSPTHALKLNGVLPKNSRINIHPYNLFTQSANLNVGWVTSKFHLFTQHSTLFNQILALLICAENSFWHCTFGVPYLRALEQSFQEYKISDSRRNIEAAIQDIKPTRLLKTNVFVYRLDGFNLRVALIARPSALNEQ
ncbi:hypothetical protein Clacol_005869 [Clathrus columnatus]|uniref:Uncharacterized protein n=1 Tax=Clathrus columnatus TaxID=1419009 RepID=A0AAV5AES1_9AGAM|nr:hypothetical protein Clacol_005869 [Clathrus columnatus]